MKWTDEKTAIVTALKEKGYKDEKQKDVFQLIDPNNPMIPTVNVKSQPKAGEHIPVYFINTEDFEGEYLQDVNGQLGAAKQLIRNAKNKLEAEQKETEKPEPAKPQAKPGKPNIKPINEVANIPTTPPPTAVQLTGQVKLSVEIIQQYINSDATMEQAFNFMAFCEAQNLDPFKQEAHLIIFGGKANNVIGVDGNIKRAQEQPDYDGYEAGIIVKKEDGSIDEREGTFLLKEETLLGGWCKVYRKNIKHPFVSKVTLDEYIQLKKDGTPNKIWNGKPATMICKVPTSQCHRKAYAGLNGGGYESCELEMKDIGDVEVIE